MRFKTIFALATIFSSLTQRPWILSQTTVLQLLFSTCSYCLEENCSYLEPQVTDLSILNWTLLYNGPNRKRRSQQFLYFCSHIRCRGNLFTEPLPSNERLLWLHYSGLKSSCYNVYSERERLMCFWSPKVASWIRQYVLYVYIRSLMWLWVQVLTKQSLKIRSTHRER
jgi:hypothetical protein